MWVLQIKSMRRHTATNVNPLTLDELRHMYAETDPDSRVWFQNSQLYREQGVGHCEHTFQDKQHKHVQYDQRQARHCKLKYATHGEGTKAMRICSRPSMSSGAAAAQRPRILRTCPPAPRCQNTGNGVSFKQGSFFGS